MMSNGNFKFKLVNILTNQFALIEEHFSEDVSTVQLSLNHKFGIDIEKRNIALKNQIRFLSDNQIFIIVEITCTFNISEESWVELRIEEKSEIVIPSGFATQLLVLTVGSARGVLHAKTENTKFNKYFLPTLDLSKSIENDIVFNVE
jgi:hypothetical protein